MLYVLWTTSNNFFTTPWLLHFLLLPLDLNLLWWNYFSVFCVAALFFLLKLLSYLYLNSIIFLFCVAQSLYSLWPCSQSRNMLENTVQCCCIAPMLWNSQGRRGNLRGIPCLSCWVCMFSREKVTNGSPAQCQCVGERPVCCSTVEGFCADGETGLWNVCYSLQSFQKGVDDYKEHR